MGEAWERAGYVFTRENSSPPRPAYVSGLFEELVEKASVPKMSVHRLRHHHASNLLAQGVELGLASKRLGHSTLAVTSDTCSHLLRVADRGMAEVGRSIVPTNSGARTLDTHDTSPASEEVVQTAERPGIP